MSTHQSILENVKIINEQRVKFTYYIIALSVAAIAFSVHQTFEQKLEQNHILLGFAIFCWALSIMLGFRFLKLNIQNFLINYSFLEYASKTDNVLKKNQAENAMRGQNKKNTDKMDKGFKWQQILFYLGIIVFLSWHILQMYLNGKIVDPKVCTC